MKYVGLDKIHGLRAIAFKGLKTRSNAKTVELHYILYDDGKTYIALHEQDYYSYHDCSSSAREVVVVQDESSWNDFMSNKIYGDSNDFEVNFG